MKRVIVVIVCLALASCDGPMGEPEPVDPPGSQGMEGPLVALYNATDGPNWTNNTNWLTGPVSTWFGVTVTGDNVGEAGEGA